MVILCKPTLAFPATLSRPSERVSHPGRSKENFTKASSSSRKPTGSIGNLGSSSLQQFSNLIRDFQLVNMTNAPVTLRTRKFVSNPLLARKQMVVDIIHPDRANVSKDDLRTRLAQLYKATKEQVSVFGIRTQFGGGKSTGFALIYDSAESLKRFEPLHRLVRYGYATKPERPSRQQRKQKKNQEKKIRGTHGPKKRNKE